MCLAYNLLKQESRDLPKVYIPTTVRTNLPRTDAESEITKYIVTLSGSSKRSTPTSIDDQPKSKKAKLVNEGNDDTQMADVVERPSPEVDTARVDNKPEPRKNTNDQKGASMNPTQELASVREKANRLLRERRHEIDGLRAELDETTLDRDSWQMRALASEADLEAFKQSSKKIGETSRKKLQDALKAEHEKKLKRAEAELADKLASAKDKLEETLLTKEIALAKKSRTKELKLHDMIDNKDEKIKELESALVETKQNAKDAEQKLRLQHREELRKCKPELSEALHGQKVAQKAALKEKETELEKLRGEKCALEEDKDRYQKQWTAVSGHNDQLQGMIRKNTRKILELQNSLTELKRNSEESDRVHDEIKAAGKAEMIAKQEMWRERYEVHFREKQETNIGLANSRRGIFLLNQANDRNFRLVKQLQEKIAQLEQKLAAAQVENDRLRIFGGGIPPVVAARETDAYDVKGADPELGCQKTGVS